MFPITLKARSRIFVREDFRARGVGVPTGTSYYPTPAEHPSDAAESSLYSCG